MTTYFTERSDAAKFAAENGSTVVEHPGAVSYLLPEEFYEQLRISGAAFAVNVREYAASRGGNLKTAWESAVNGEIPGMSAGPLAALDEQFRRPVRGTPSYSVATADKTVDPNVGMSWPSERDDSW